MMFRKLYNQLKFEVVLGVRCYCPDHGIKWNAEVGVRNSELRVKENFKIQNSPFRIPKSSFTYHSIIPILRQRNKPKRIHIFSISCRISETYHWFSQRLPRFIKKTLQSDLRPTRYYYVFCKFPYTYHLLGRGDKPG